MYCGKCGAANQDGSFCSRCGFQNKGQPTTDNKPKLNSNVRSKSRNEGNVPQTKVTFWEILGVVFGITWIFTGINILSDPNCNSVLPASGSRYTLSLACSSSGDGGQGAGILVALIGAAIILFSLRKLFFKQKG